MSDVVTPPNQITDTLVKVVNLLTPLTPHERLKVVRSAIALLNDESGNLTTAIAPMSIAVDTHVNHQNNHGELPPKAKAWMTQNALTMESLESIFHFSSEGVDIIAADVPGNGNKDKVQSTYLLSGIVGFLSTGTAFFEDSKARDLCCNFGCFDQTNHSKSVKALGNAVVGDKNKGWTLTAPGLKKAAELLKDIANEG